MCNTDCSRRTFLSGAGVSLGLAALGTLLGREGVAAASAAHAGHYRGLAGFPHHVPTAKRVIFLCMAGGPSQIETFDYKPKLEELHNQPMPASITAGQPVAQLQGKELKAFRPMAKFRRHGQSGQWISDLLPHTARIIDDLCIVRSMTTEQINHDPAHTFMNTGTAISGRPSMGSWVNYGLGSESDELPGFVVLTSRFRGGAQPIASRQWSSGFLPSQFQGVEFNSAGETVHYVRNPPGVGTRDQRRLVELVQSLDAHRQQITGNAETTARIAAYEMAFRMQMSVPRLMDFSDEPRGILEMYGANPGDGSYASNCLLARRLVERGVRFVHLYHRGWDHHNNLEPQIKVGAKTIDRATWALVTDLKQRGMLEDTLVIWGGEFGRTPMVQFKDTGSAGRDHHIKGFTMWMAGGGIKPGTAFGNTDELGYHAVEKPVHVRDLHATMLHTLGIDHNRFSVPYQGLDMRLTGVEPARVVSEILA